MVSVDRLWQYPKCAEDIPAAVVRDINILSEKSATLGLGYLTIKDGLVSLGIVDGDNKLVCELSNGEQGSSYSLSCADGYLANCTLGYYSGDFAITLESPKAAPISPLCIHKLQRFTADYSKLYINGNEHTIKQRMLILSDDRLNLLSGDKPGELVISISDIGRRSQIGGGAPEVSRSILKSINSIPANADGDISITLTYTGGFATEDTITEGSTTEETTTSGSITVQAMFTENNNTALIDASKIKAASPNIIEDILRDGKATATRSRPLDVLFDDDDAYTTDHLMSASEFELSDKFDEIAEETP